MKNSTSYHVSSLTSSVKIKTEKNELKKPTSNPDKINTKLKIEEIAKKKLEQLNKSISESQQHKENNGVDKQDK